ncbi:MAG: cytochrome c [Gemmatimonadetes bacterium]|nr:cytochrome c [Gemmatimonadota bacterium]MBI3567861.1 cytochrome c [Gemmatimonadota bacterium]
MRASAVILTLCLAGAACGSRDSAPARYGLGRAATPAEIAALDIDATPTGHGLPPGHGSAADGAVLFQQKCAMCHGAQGQGMAPAFPALVGRDPKGEGFPFAKDWKITHTIGNYWPEATTVFDYVRRAMPHPAPGSLSNDEVYALTAWLLAANQVIPADAVLDSASLVKVKMPYHDRFVKDDRHGGAEVK